MHRFNTLLRGDPGYDMLIETATQFSKQVTDIYVERLCPEHHILKCRPMAFIRAQSAQSQAMHKALEVSEQGMTQLLSSHSALGSDQWVQEQGNQKQRAAGSYSVSHQGMVEVAM